MNCELLLGDSTFELLCFSHVIVDDTSFRLTLEEAGW